MKPYKINIANGCTKVEVFFRFMIIFLEIKQKSHDYFTQGGKLIIVNFFTLNEEIQIGKRQED